MNFPSIGKLAPDFTLKSQTGELVTLSSFRGKKQVVVYFYPKADTPGCTAQACGIKESHSDFEAIDTVILAISPDSPAKLQKFTDKYALDFILLSDEDHKVAEDYGVWGLKKFMGREFMGIIRTTFVIDRQGKLKQVMDKVNTKTHNQDLLEILHNGI